jgi:hypothetical protein
MEFPRIIYRSGGSWALESGMYSVRQVESAEELQAAQADGWHLDQYAAKAAADAPAEPAAPAEPTRADLEAQATAKGLKFDGRTTDKKLAAMIAAAGA